MTNEGWSFLPPVEPIQDPVLQMLELYPSGIMPQLPSYLTLIQPSTNSVSQNTREDVKMTRNNQRKEKGGKSKTTSHKRTITTTTATTKPRVSTKKPHTTPKYSSDIRGRYCLHSSPCKNCKQWELYLNDKEIYRRPGKCMENPSMQRKTNPKKT